MTNSDTHLPPRIVAAVATFGNCLVLDEPEAWLRSLPALKRRLEPRELASIAFAALRALDPELREDTVRAALFDVSAGYPLPCFTSPLSDARWWAGNASRDELKAYSLAAFEAMQPRDQSAFLSHVAGEQAA